MAYCVFTNCLSVLGSGITPYTSLDSRSGVSLTSNGQMLFVGSSDNSGPLGMVFQHICANGICRSDITSTRYGISGNDLSLNVDSPDPNTAGGLYIKYRGNVGIGTSAPDTLLHIKNCVNGGTNNYLLTLQNTCTVSDARAGIAFLDNSNTVGSGGISGASIQAANNGVDGTGHLLFSSLVTGTATERMRITSGGNVGIGTTSPCYKLQSDANAASTCTDSIVAQNSGVSTIGHTTGIRFRFNTAEPAAIRTILENVGTGTARLGLFVSTDNTGANLTERLSINCNGNVGINTTSPSTKLAVEGSATDAENIARFNNQVNCASRIIVRNSNHTAYLGISSTSTADTLATGMCAGAMTLGFGNNFPIQFWNGTGPSTVKMTITSAGDVGIATGAPSGYGHGGTNKILEILNPNTTSNAQAHVILSNGATSCNGSIGSITWAGTNYSSANRAGIISVATETTATTIPQSYMQFYTSDSTGGILEKMRITSCGNVGINCTSPSYKLHVNGTFYAAGSSKDYKEGICQYDTDSCMFMKLKPVTYQYKDEFKHLGKELKSQTQIGLIAEEVAEVAPELAILVKENDSDVVRNVDYEKLSILLLSEVQKLRKEVDDLKTK